MSGTVVRPGFPRPPAGTRGHGGGRLPDLSFIFSATVNHKKKTLRHFSLTWLGSGATPSPLPLQIITLPVSWNGAPTAKSWSSGGQQSKGTQVRRGVLVGIGRFTCANTHPGSHLGSGPPPLRLTSRTPTRPVLLARRWVENQTRLLRSGRCKRPRPPAADDGSKRGRQPAGRPTCR